MRRVVVTRMGVPSFASSKRASATTGTECFPITLSLLVRETVVTSTSPRRRMSTVARASVSSKPSIRNSATFAMILHLAQKQVSSPLSGSCALESAPWGSPPRKTERGRGNRPLSRKVYNTRRRGLDAYGTTMGCAISTRSLLMVFPSGRQPASFTRTMAGR